MYTYTNKLGKNYILYWSEVKLVKGSKTRVYFLLREDKQPTNNLIKAYRAESLPKTMTIKEIGKYHTPIVYKVKNGEDK